MAAIEYGIETAGGAQIKEFMDLWDQLEYKGKRRQQLGPSGERQWWRCCLGKSSAFHGDPRQSEPRRQGRRLPGYVERTDRENQEAMRGRRSAGRSRHRREASAA